jgi:enterochelin esterase family protein
LARHRGVEALFAGFRHPEAIGKVLSQSGSFWWKPEGDVEPEWLARQLAATPKLPLEILLQVGLMEVPDQLGSNRHMRDVLTARGYAVSYSEANANHSAVLWRGIFADGLVRLLGIGNLP